jgi:hypothetical protein
MARTSNEALLTIPGRLGWVQGSPGQPPTRYPHQGHAEHGQHEQTTGELFKDVLLITELTGKLERSRPIGARETIGEQTCPVAVRSDNRTQIASRAEGNTESVEVGGEWWRIWAWIEENAPRYVEGEHNNRGQLGGVGTPQ